MAFTKPNSGDNSLGVFSDSMNGKGLNSRIRLGESRDMSLIEFHDRAEAVPSNSWTQVA